jgi:hypothetical protein
MLYVSDQSDVKLRGTAAVTILLCPDVLAHFQGYVAASGAPRGAILRNLVRLFGVKVARCERNTSARTRYQTARQGLVRYNLKVDADTWARIQVMARGLGVSACMVVDQLLRMHAGPSSGGVPTSRHIVPRPNIRVTLRVCWEIEMTKSSMSRRMHLGQYVRDRVVARRAAAVRAYQKAWARNPFAPDQERMKKPGPRPGSSQ